MLAGMKLLKIVRATFAGTAGMLAIAWAVWFLHPRHPGDFVALAIAWGHVAAVFSLSFVAAGAGVAMVRDGRCRVPTTFALLVAATAGAILIGRFLVSPVT